MASDVEAESLEALVSFPRGGTLKRPRGKAEQEPPAKTATRHRAF
jgi:hypothetical protein